MTVYWLLPPVSPGTQALSKFSGDESLYEDFIRSIQSRFPDVVIIDGRHSGFDPSVFLDEVHLDRDGASRLSIGLAEVLAHAAPATSRRWIGLPDFLGPPAAEPFEDIAQSRMALQAGAPLRR